MNLFREFIKSEDGFLGALAGAALGGLFGKGSGAVLAKGLGTALGKRFDERKAQGKANAYAAGAIQRTVNQARAAGIHPLEAIRSGHSNQGQILPRIGTSASFGDQFDQIDSILTGREAQKDALRESQTQLNRIEADERRRGATTSTTPGSFNRMGNNFPKSSVAPVIGDTNTIPELDDGRATVTNPHSTEYGKVVDPTQPDFAMQEERGGDNEILNLPLILRHHYNDWEYNNAVEYASNRLGIPKDELHQRITNDPSIRDKLPGPLARVTMDAQSLFQYLTKPKNSSPRPARLPADGHIREYGAQEFPWAGP